MNKVHFSTGSGRSVLKCDGITYYRRQYVNIYMDGEIHFDAVNDDSCETLHQAWAIARRVYFNTGVDQIMTLKLKKQFFNENKKLFQKVVDGMSVSEDVFGNPVPDITDEAQDAKDQLDQIASAWKEFGY